MSRGSRIAPAERRRWLEQYEEGSRIDKIAREAGRTQRTINEHLARARRERQQHEVTAGLLTQAYQKHYSRLLDLAQELGQASLQPNSEGLLGEADLESRMLHQALRSHTPKARLWRAVKVWEETSQQLERESQRIRRRIQSSVDRETKTAPGILREGFVDTLWSAVSMFAQGQDPFLVDYRIEVPGDNYQLRWRNFLLADGVGSREQLDKIQEQHQRLLTELATPDTAAPLADLTARWNAARDTIQEEVVTLRLRQILPGQCRLCPGGEAPSGVHTPRARRSDE